MDETADTFLFTPQQSNDSLDTIFKLNDEEYINHDYGLITNVPNQIVVVPSPYIHSIMSPDGTPFMTPMLSPMMSPMGTFMGYQQAYTLNNFLAPLPVDQVPLVSFDDFLGNDLTLSETTKTESSETEKDEPVPGVHKTVPEGKFWKTIKTEAGTAYQCPWPDCKKNFTRPYNLKSHYRGHTGERPYACTYQGCKSAFSRKHDLKRHSKLHEGIRPFSCPICEKGFARNDALKRHIKPSENSKESTCGVEIRNLFESGNAKDRYSGEALELVTSLYELIQ